MVSHIQSPIFNPNPNFLEPNNDDLERAQSRAARAASSRRRSAAFSPPHLPVRSSQPFLDQDQIMDLFHNCIKLASENKINQKNTWEFGLIDHLSEIIRVRSDDEDNETNFQKASCTLEAGVKIYSLRVDSVHSETYKVLGGINRAGRAEEKEENVGDGDHADTDQVEGLAKKDLNKKFSPLTTLESSFEALNVKKFDGAFTVDPLYHQTSAQFDEGGAKGLLLNNLGVYGGCRVIFDSFESPEKNILSDQNTQCADVIDLSFAKENIKQMMMCVPVKNDISPTLGDLVNLFDEDNRRPSVPAAQKQIVEEGIDDYDHTEVEANPVDDCGPWSIDHDDHASYGEGAPSDSFANTDENFPSHQDENGPDHWEYRKSKDSEQIWWSDTEAETTSAKPITKTGLVDFDFMKSLDKVMPNIFSTHSWISSSISSSSLRISHSSSVPPSIGMFGMHFEKDAQINVKPKNSDFGIVLRMDVNSENDNMNVPEHVRLEKQSLVASTATSIVVSAVGILMVYILVLVGDGKHQIQVHDGFEACLVDDSANLVVWLWNYLARANYISRVPLDSSFKAELPRNHEDGSNKEGKSALFSSLISWKRVGSEKISRDSISAFSVLSDGHFLAISSTARSSSTFSIGLNFANTQSSGLCQSSTPSFLNPGTFGQSVANQHNRVMQLVLVTNDCYLHHHSSTGFPSRDKYHYVLSTWVVLNSTVMNAKEPGKHVFHIVTGRLQFPALKMWFIAHLPSPATVNVESNDDFKWLNSSFWPDHQPLESASMKEFYFKANHSSTLSEWEEHFKYKNPNYLSMLNHVRFYMPELFPKLDNIVFQKDLTPLWSIVMKRMVTGAVGSCNKNFHEFSLYLHFERPEISSNFDPHACGWVFGMNILDLKQWKKRNITGLYHHWQDFYKDQQQLWYWAIYNSDSQLMSLELLPMKPYTEMDVTIFGSGNIRKDDGSGFCLENVLGQFSGLLDSLNADGVPIYLSAIKEWMIEFGASMIFVSIRTDVAWYRLGAATILQNSNVARKYGISGPFWCASGATIHVPLFRVMTMGIKSYLNMIQVLVKMSNMSGAENHLSKQRPPPPSLHMFPPLVKFSGNSVQEKNHHHQLPWHLAFKPWWLKPIKFPRNSPQHVSKQKLQGEDKTYLMGSGQLSIPKTTIKRIIQLQCSKVSIGLIFRVLISKAYQGGKLEVVDSSYCARSWDKIVLREGVFDACQMPEFSSAIVFCHPPITPTCNMPNKQRRKLQLSIQLSATSARHLSTAHRQLFSTQMFL